MNENYKTNAQKSIKTAIIKTKEILTIYYNTQKTKTKEITTIEDETEKLIKTEVSLSRSKIPLTLKRLITGAIKSIIEIQRAIPTLPFNNETHEKHQELEILTSELIILSDKITPYTKTLLNEKEESINNLNKLIKEVRESHKKLLKNIEISEGMNKENTHKIIKNKNTIEKLESSIKKLENPIEEKILEVDEFLNKKMEALQKKEDDVNKLLGIISGKSIAGSYENCASDEKTMADWLRYGSLACMGIIAAVLLYSLYETTQSSFNIENSTFRVVFTLILSIPAAYLARESTRHRQQQYQHLQTSLDLKAITPYIASLPETEQHKIKYEVAHRLFASKQSTVNNGDPNAFPINTHELLIKVIDKLDFKESKTKEDKPKTEDEKVTTLVPKTTQNGTNAHILSD